LATVTGLTADRMLAIEGASVVDGDVVGDNLILTKHDGSQINAGSVRGPAGPAGPVGSDLAVVSARAILDVGLANQIRAGRQLGPADFNAVGLTAPLGLWNLSDLSDVSGNGRNLLNKGNVTFAPGVNGVAATAAQFTGSTAQALYIPDDAGGALPGAAFRLRAGGSWGIWTRTGRRDTNQQLMSKDNIGTTQSAWVLSIDSTNVALLGLSNTGNGYPYILYGVTDLTDDRWHHVVATYDGACGRIYVDGVLEASIVTGCYIFNSTAPVNIGARGGDAASASLYPHFGRLDEAFITSDILTEDQVRNLYCAKLSHTLAAVPSRVTLNVRRRRKGAAFVPGDFSAPPLRLYNFSAGALVDEGTANLPLTASGPVPAAGADGSLGNAYSFWGSPQSLYGSSVGLPVSGSRSYGCWFKTQYPVAGNFVIMAWGTLPGNDFINIFVNTGCLFSWAGTGSQLPTGFTNWVADGQWHFIVIVDNNTPVDGVYRKNYLDGRLIQAQTAALATIAPPSDPSANKFRIGSHVDGTSNFIGTIDNVFVCNYAMAIEEIQRLYMKSSGAWAPSPKNVGDHIEALNLNDLLVSFETLDPTAQIDLAVAA
jgi:Concanavalin A-like lectin/glucanases superfamily